MNIRRFTMDEGMATLDVTLRSFMPAARNQDIRDGAPATMRLPLRAQLEFDNEEGWEKPGKDRLVQSSMQGSLVSPVARKLG